MRARRRAVAPDGATVYPAARRQRHGRPSTGAPPPPARPRRHRRRLPDQLLPQHLWQSATNLGTISEIAVTPDGKQLLLAISNQNAVLAWDRATSGASQGTVTPTSRDRPLRRQAARPALPDPPGILTHAERRRRRRRSARPRRAAQQSLSKIDRQHVDQRPTATGRQLLRLSDEQVLGLQATPGILLPFFRTRESAATARRQGGVLRHEARTRRSGASARTGGVITWTRPRSGCINMTATEACRTFRQGNACRSSGRAGQPQCLRRREQPRVGVRRRPARRCART